jgi:hypothetical protein
MTDQIVVTVIVSAVVAIVAAFILQLSFKEKDESEKFEKIELLKVESSSLMLLFSAISTITFYEGNVDNAQSYLFERLKKIVALNRWLEGRLERGSNNKLYLKYTKEKQKHDAIQPKIFQCIEDPQLNESMNYEVVTERLSQLVVKEGGKVVGKNEPLFRVTMIRISSSKFALFFSLSHVIADGHTFYSLYSMLCETITPRALIVQRTLDFSQRLETAMKGNDASNWGFSIGMAFNIMTTMLFSKKPETVLTDLPAEKIAAEKEKYASSSLPSINSNQKPSFVSTNDILTSWYFKLCRCDVGLMAMNFRNRFSDLTDDHAGNYEALIAYQPIDFMSPSLIRQSLPLYHRVNKHIALPSSWRSLRTKVALLTNWSTFYHEIQIPNSRHLCHFPYDPNQNVVFADTSIIFCPRAKELQLLSRTISSEPETLLPF